MKTQNLALLLGTAVLLAGCVVTSVHPYYNTRDIIYDSSLVGTWTNAQESNQSWTFENAGEKVYRLTYVENGKTNVARGNLFKINGATFLDFVAWEQDSDIMPPPIPSHFLLRVLQLNSTLRLAALNNDWLRTQLDTDPKIIGHAMLGEKDDRRVVLTAETVELQAFLRKHLATDAAWQDPFDLKRAP